MYTSNVNKQLLTYLLLTYSLRIHIIYNRITIPLPLCWEINATNEEGLQSRRLFCYRQKHQNNSSKNIIKGKGENVISCVIILEKCKCVSKLCVSRK